MMQEFEAAVREQEAAKNRFGGFTYDELEMIYRVFTYSGTNWGKEDKGDVFQKLGEEIRAAMWMREEASNG